MCGSPEVDFGGINDRMEVPPMVTRIAKPTGVVKAHTWKSIRENFSTVDRNAVSRGCKAWLMYAVCLSGSDGRWVVFGLTSDLDSAEKMVQGQEFILDMDDMSGINTEPFGSD